MLFLHTNVTKNWVLHLRGFGTKKSIGDTNAKMNQ